eukprot:79340_1
MEVQPQIPENSSVEEQIAAILEANKLRAKENDLFASFIYRNTPHDDSTLDTSSPAAKGALQEISAGEGEPTSEPSDTENSESPRNVKQTADDPKSDKNSSPKQQKDAVNIGSPEFPVLTEEEAVEKHAKLTTMKRLDMSKKEQKYLREELELLNVNAEKDIDALKAVLTESKIRINEIRKDAYEFRRDIVVGSESTGTGKINAEKVIRHWEENNLAKDQQHDKLKQKNQSLKTQISKMDSQLKQKEQQGGGLHSIDLEQLKIENSQYNQKILEKNKELLRLKMTTGKTVQVLNTAKQDLTQLITESKSLNSDISDRQETIRRLKDELTKVGDEYQIQQKKNETLKQKTVSGYENLQIMDYVDQKSAEHELELSITNWERKVEIAQMGAKRANKTLRRFAEWQHEQSSN